MGSLTHQMLVCVCAGPERSADQLRHFRGKAVMRGLFFFFFFILFFWVGVLMYSMCSSTCTLPHTCLYLCEHVWLLSLSPAIFTFAVHFSCSELTPSGVVNTLWHSAAGPLLLINVLYCPIQRDWYFTLIDSPCNKVIHRDTFVCACVCVSHNWGVHVPISSASCAPVWIWQRATGPFPRGVLNVYSPEVPTLCTPPWYHTILCMWGACWNF